MVLLTLLQNVALIVLLSAVQQLVFRRWNLSNVPGKIVSGLLFGGVGILTMMTGFALAPGVIYDGRSIVLSIGGLFGGPVVAGIAAIICAAYRLWLGGAGAVVGVGVIVESALLGVVLYYLRRRGLPVMSAWALWGFGLVVHLVMLAIQLGLPGGAGPAVVMEVGPAVLVLFPMATLLVARLFLDQEERLRAQKELADEAERLHLALEAGCQGLYDFDVKSGAVSVNPEYATMLGFEPGRLQVTQGSWLKSLHPDDVEPVKQRLADYLEGKTPEYRAEFRQRTSDGGWQWILSRGRIVERDAHGEPTRMLGTHTDITERKMSERELAQHRGNLEMLLEERAHDLDLLNRSLESVIDVLGSVVEIRDPYTAGHQRRVSELATSIARELGMSEHDIEDLRVAGLMHDVGKIAVPTEILSKPGRLTPAEFSLIRQHPEVGYRLTSSAFPEGPIAEVVWQHHERCDGSGYPRGLSGDEMLLGAKVIMVADVVEAMSSNRPYRPEIGVDAALTEIERGAGSVYDADVAAACLRLFRDEAFTFAHTEDRIFGS